MVYEWKPQTRIKTKADVAGAECERLASTVGLTAKNLLDASRPSDAPLHDEFEWDDAVAAEAYREDQARYIIRSLCIKSEKADQTPVRAFFTIASPEYEPVFVIIKDEDKRTALLAQAIKELQAFQQKYDSLRELQTVFAAIETLAAGM